VASDPILIMTATHKGTKTVIEVKKADGQISVKLGSKKTLSDKVASLLNGK
jgi:hypothetical protein